MVKRKYMVMIRAQTTTIENRNVLEKIVEQNLVFVTVCTPHLPWAELRK